ncbi:MAG TPA: phosphoglucomutase/phosphomannomutase family protein [Bacilli bacterium]|nr:phosphoglucomutase/phosphomannomutase family protein [Bacilli bacterium]
MEIIFGTEGWRGKIADTFTVHNARIVCQGMADDLIEREVADQGVVIGYDTRFLSYTFACECARVLAANGISVYLLDSVTPTPLLSFAVKYLGAAAGLMITASHNPPEYNGIKWKGPHAGPVSEADIRRLAAHVGKTKVRTMPWVEAKAAGLIQLTNCDEPYASALRRFLAPVVTTTKGSGSKRKLHVVVDTMHGAAGSYFANALEAVGCKVTRLRHTPDPMFGGVTPEPIKQNLGLLMEKVLEVHADLGIATDGDGDRLGAVDEQGNFVSPQVLFSLLTLHLLRERGWAGTVVKTFSTTKMIDRLAKRHAVKLREVPIGFKHITDCMQQEDVLIGGEESGGIGIPQHMMERDGQFAGLLLIEHLLATGHSLSAAVEDLLLVAGPHEYERIDVHLPVRQKELLFKSLHQKPQTFAGFPVAEVETLDGIKYVFADNVGWILFRPSGTEPLLRVYAEMKNPHDLHKVLSAAKQLIDGGKSKLVKDS